MFGIVKKSSLELVTKQLEDKTKELDLILSSVEYQIAKHSLNIKTDIELLEAQFLKLSQDSKDIKSKAGNEANKIKDEALREANATTDVAKTTAEQIINVAESDALELTNSAKQIKHAALQEANATTDLAKTTAEQIINVAESDALELTNSAKQIKHEALQEANTTTDLAKTTAEQIINAAESSALKLTSNTKQIKHAALQEANTTTDLAKTTAEQIINSAEKMANKVIKKASTTINSASTSADNMIKSAENKAQVFTDNAEEMVKLAEHKAKDIVTVAHSNAAKLKIEIEKEAIAKTEELTVNLQKLEREKSLLTDTVVKLDKRAESSQRRVDKLKTELQQVDDLSSITPYEYLIDGPISDSIKASMEKVKDKQKKLIINNKAFQITSSITWNNSESKGKTRQNRLGKFLIKAFNSEVDNLITNTTSRSFINSAKKIEKWFEAVNKGGADDYVKLNRELLILRLEEHRYAFEYQMKKEMELDDQRYLRDTIREEDKVKKEIEKFVIAREKEEKAFEEQLQKAEKKVKEEAVTTNEINRLQQHILELRQKLENATSEKERALSMAQLTRSGYVYIISNKGSFGENVYKIGMTRRLDPMDRVKELGDASVPFFFDVHAMIPSEDAPTLEKQLHKHFSSNRINKVNLRREYFKVSIEEIEDALNELFEGDIELIKDATASQFEESKLIKNKLETSHA